MNRRTFLKASAAWAAAVECGARISAAQVSSAAKRVRGRELSAPVVVIGALCVEALARYAQPVEGEASRGPSPQGAPPCPTTVPRNSE